MHIDIGDLSIFLNEINALFEMLHDGIVLFVMSLNFQMERNGNRVIVYS